MEVVVNVYEAMEKALEVVHPKPVHFYDICDEKRTPVWAVRQWLDEKKRGPMLYPPHGRPLYGTTPFTMFRCKVCGSTEMGSPWELPTSKLGCRVAAWKRDLNDANHEPEWEVMDRAGAAGYLYSIETDPSIVDRVMSL